MTEAPTVVASSFQRTNENWDVNVDQEVPNPKWQSGIRSWKKWFARFMMSLQNVVYPGHLWSLWIIISVVIAVHFSSNAVPYDLVNKLVPLLPEQSFTYKLGACTMVGLGIWFVIISTMRQTLKLLLMYKGWMYESRGRGSKVSTTTKLWIVFVKIFSGWNRPRLYSFQGSLPRLPLPSVHDTVQRYLQSVRPVFDDEKYHRMENLAKNFESGIGVKLQRYLWLKSWWSNNYVTDWWEEYVYLRGRSPLMINSNFYCIDAIFTPPTHKQAARAAGAISSFLACRQLIDGQELEPIMIQGLIPLCSRQYERVFNTTRIPGLETDKIQHWADSNHIVVYHKGKFFKVVIYNGRILKPCEIQMQMEQILNDKSEPYPYEDKLAALTAGERTHWANARRVYFNKGVNKQSLDLIEKAAFVVVLDDVPYEYDEKDPSKLDNYGKILFHGTGFDRWFDKSFTLCIGTNGRIGFNAEHSWGDAPVIVHLWEYVIIDDLMERYDKEGNIIGKPGLIPPSPVRLTWDIKQECRAAIDIAIGVANKLIADFDLRIYVHNHYGKDFIKHCRLSPDAFLQMALQLAYFRDAGQFSLTYEASMTRLFREGRTETVRPCTLDSCAWVKAMDDSSTSTQERVKLLQVACQTHQVSYQDAMCGKGIDRHLFCLYVVSKYLEVESPFLHEVLSEPWRLSTSQTPQGQSGRMDLKKHPNCISPGGGFGPVTDDGYSVSYIIVGEDLIFFHISNKKSSKQADCHRFARQIERALLDMKKLFNDYDAINGKK